MTAPEPPPKRVKSPADALLGDPLKDLPWHRGRGATFRHMVLTWFGCGMSPWAPGTVGSLGALPLGLTITWAYGPIALAAAAALLFVAGWWIAAVHLREDASANDPQWIVVDEVVGQWIALAAVPFHPLGVLVAFGLFRLCDIIKPWPVSWADRRVGGALGIMLDDLLAGLYAALGGFGAIYGFRAIWNGLT
jgi:phosphatidylglycerophosphatase A